MRPHFLLVCLACCGYEPLYATPAGAALHVHLVKDQVSSAMVAEEVVRGAREMLAQEGALAPGDGYPRLEIEVLRVDERGEGIARAPGDVPQARASELGVLARGHVVRHAGAPAETDTGDMRAEDLAGAPLGDPTREVWQREDAVRAVARRLGARLAGRVLGHPVTNMPPP